MGQRLTPAPARDKIGHEHASLRSASAEPSCPAPCPVPAGDWPPRRRRPRHRPLRHRLWSRSRRCNCATASPSRTPPSRPTFRSLELKAARAASIRRDYQAMVAHGQSTQAQADRMVKIVEGGENAPSPPKQYAVTLSGRDGKLLCVSRQTAGKEYATDINGVAHPLPLGHRGRALRRAQDLRLFQPDGADDDQVRLAGDASPAPAGRRAARPAARQAAGGRPAGRRRRPVGECGQRWAGLQRRGDTVVHPRRFRPAEPVGGGSTRRRWMGGSR